MCSPAAPALACLAQADGKKQWWVSGWLLQIGLDQICDGRAAFCINCRPYEGLMKIPHASATNRQGGKFTA